MAASFLQGDRCDVTQQPHLLVRLGEQPLPDHLPAHDLGAAVIEMARPLARILANERQDRAVRRSIAAALVFTRRRLSSTFLCRQNERPVFSAGCSKADRQLPPDCAMQPQRAGGGNRTLCKVNKRPESGMRFYPPGDRNWSS